MAKSTTDNKRKRHQPTINTVGDNIRALRLEKGMTVKNLAELAECEAKLIYNYESGKVDISVSMVYFLAVALGVEPHTLLIPKV
ncbi:helix-turn-helix domain-containing protein [Pedobacter sp. MR2016-24]|uniref:helix-turn-helix domain-containing protein n=1 Tax=Pedobacter sp. MR2016-24 TaxID=2994466 RepID=UPI0022467174|nr:helix-turn-helix transcriptional regulator [Pedobacter sp. MR2016-24]MCX2486582.1 helix-turn-helix transcriptional regulator [Pedobacter sp. MR2016-24]